MQQNNFISMNGLINIIKMLDFSSFLFFLKKKESSIGKYLNVTR